MNDQEFAQRFEGFLTRRGRSPERSIFSYVEEWENVVADCADRYGFCSAELANDCAVRTLLHEALTDEELRPSHQIDLARVRIDAADAQFWSLLRTDVGPRRGPTRPWWLAGILRRAGDTYTDEVLSLYGVEIERC